MGLPLYKLFAATRKDGHSCFYIDTHSKYWHQNLNNREDLYFNLKEIKKDSSG